MIDQLQPFGLRQARRALQDLCVGRRIPLLLNRLEKAVDVVRLLPRTRPMRLRQRRNRLH